VVPLQLGIPAGQQSGDVIPPPLLPPHPAKAPLILAPAPLPHCCHRHAAALLGRPVQAEAVPPVQQHPERAAAGRLVRDGRAGGPAAGHQRPDRWGMADGERCGGSCFGATMVHTPRCNTANRCVGELGKGEGGGADRSIREGGGLVEVDVWVGGGGGGGG
jgi:hypothetical protein